MQAIIKQIGRGLIAGGRRLRGAVRSYREAAGPGGVEIFSETVAEGWVSVPTNGPPRRVDLFLDDFCVASTNTFATDTPNRQNFRFQLRDIWKYCGPNNRLTVRLSSRPLGHQGLPFSYSPEQSGQFEPMKLADLLSTGRVFNQKGALQLSKDHDNVWRRNVSGLFKKLSADFLSLHGRPLSVCYGTLLGTVREANYIGHDHDFDACFICTAKTPGAARAEALKIAVSLRNAGYRVKLKRSCAYYYHDDFPRVFIDVFHLFFDAEGVLQFPFGAAGERLFTTEDMTGYAEMTLADAQVPVIADPEKLVETIYGPGWRIPNPGFSWGRDRKRSAPRGPRLLDQLGGQTALYARFFVHAITDAAEDRLFALAKRIIGGSVLAVEFRTARDRTRRRSPRPISAVS